MHGQAIAAQHIVRAECKVGWYDLSAFSGLGRVSLFLKATTTYQNHFRHLQSPVESLLPFVRWVERLRNPSLCGGVGSDGLRKRFTHPTKCDNISANLGTDLALPAHIFNLGIPETKIRFVLGEIRL